MVSAFLSIICSLIVIFSLSPPVHGTIIDFEGYSTGTYIDTEYDALGVTFNPGGNISFLGPDSILSVSPNIVALFGDGVSVNKVDVDYFSSVPLTLEAYDSGDTLIDSVNTAAGSGSFGLSTNTIIKKVIIHDNGYDFAIDNFSFSVPEASTWILLFSCLLGLCYMKRKAF
jgi:hypothetical protein